MPILPEDIERHGRWRDAYVKDLRKAFVDYDTDPRMTLRLSYHKCKRCFYLKNGLATQAFTRYTCEHCGQEKMHPNGNTPRICPECAKALNICQFCCAPID